MDPPSAGFSRPPLDAATAAGAVGRRGLQRPRAVVLLLVGLRGFQARVKGRMALAHAGLRDVGIGRVPLGMRSGSGSVREGDSLSHTTLDSIPGVSQLMPPSVSLTLSCEQKVWHLRSWAFNFISPKRKMLGKVDLCYMTFPLF